MRLLCLLLGTAGLLLACRASAQSKPPRTENLLIVIIDGLRWQEVFGESPPPGTGEPADRNLTSAQRRRALLPFLWDTVAARGQLYGNRRFGNQVNVANYQRFSYPGYQELLAGAADPHVLRNRAIESHKPTVLDFFSQQPALRGQVAVFASWSTLEAILHATSGHFPVNAGWQPASGKSLSHAELCLNAEQQDGLRRWVDVRADTLTAAYALAYVQRAHPRVLYLALGETDEYAHAHQYGNYLRAAHRADSCLARLWAYLQSTPQYRGKTTLVFTTDHGRGRGRWWSKHNGFVPGSRQAWLAVLGPDTPPTGEQRTRGRIAQSQLARTLAALLGLAYHGPSQAGPVIRTVLTSTEDESPGPEPPLVRHE